MSARIAVFPGSFDPPTLGHLDVIERSQELFDRLVIGILDNPLKQPFLAYEKRLGLIADEVKRRAYEHVEVQRFSGLAIDFARLIGAAWIVRGLRSIGDLEDEWAMALTNRAASGGIIDTVFIPSRPEFSHIRARLVKEIAVGGGRLSGLVPDRVALEIENALQKSRPKRGR